MTKWKNVVVVFAYLLLLLAPTTTVAQSIPVQPGKELEAFKTAQEKLLQSYEVRATSIYPSVGRLKMSVHVLAGGKGYPVIFLHGGGATAATFAPLLKDLQDEFSFYAPDRPGCGLTDKIDYTGISFRLHAIDFVSSLMDELNLKKASIVGSSIGGYWALVFALAHPERVDKLVLIGEPAFSLPPGSEIFAKPITTIPDLEMTKRKYAAKLVFHINNVSDEMLKLDLAGFLLPNAVLSWNSMLEQVDREGKRLTYALRPELKNLKCKTLFIWGEQDKFAPPVYGQEMANLIPDASCTVVKDAGHLVWMDQPTKCSTLLKDFLNQH